MNERVDKLPAHSRADLASTFAGKAPKGIHHLSAGRRTKLKPP